MPELDLVPIRDCTNPAIANALPDYCFGALSGEESRRVEAHVLECAVCHAKAETLAQAVEALRNDKALLKAITPAELGSAFGSSAKLNELPVGGHGGHIWAAAVIFSLYFVASLLLEVSYQWDTRGMRALVASPIVFGILTAGLMWLSGSITHGERTNRRMSVGWTVALFLAPIAVVYISVCLFVLPNTNITLDHTSGWTARIAYLKDVVYMLPIALVFLIEPFRFVVALQGELSDGKHGLVESLLSGNKHAVVPRGVFFLKPGGLWMAVGLLLTVHTFLTWHLIDSLEPSLFQTLFLALAFVRIGSYFALIAECMAWYYSALNELKREAFSARTAG